MPTHIWGSGTPPTPCRHSGAVQPSQEGEQFGVGVAEVFDHFGRLEGEIPLNRADTAALEVHPPQTVRGDQAVGVMRFAMQPLLLDTQLVEHGNALVNDDAKKIAVARCQCSHERVVVECFSSAPDGPAECR